MEHHVELLPRQHSRGEKGHWGEPDNTYLRVRCSDGQLRNFGYGYVDSTGQCCREYKGGILPGPYGYLYGTATVIAAVKLDAPTMIAAEIGDTLVMPDGVRFTITAIPQDAHNLKLTLDESHNLD